VTLRPEENVQRGLISTTSRLLGEYQGDGLLLAHAWGDHTDQSMSRWNQGPASRSAYALSFETPARDPKDNHLPDYTPMVDVVCSYLAVLFGKRFDSHGLNESSGLFYLPDLSAFNQLCDQNLPHNTHSPRVDYPVPLNLVEVARIAPLMELEADSRPAAAFEGAAKFYLRALQSAEQDREVAYLHLVTAGEVLSNAYDYELADLLDAQVSDALDRIRSGLDDGGAIAGLLSNRLRQIRRRFLRTILSLVDDSFFERSEATVAYSAFQPESFEASIAAAYDLRSRYLHTGVPFGGWMRPAATQAEVQLGQPVVQDSQLATILGRAPTFIGLERVVRYCLLRFAESSGLYLDAGGDA